MDTSDTQLQARAGHVATAFHNEVQDWGKKVMLGRSTSRPRPWGPPEEVAEVLRRALEFVDADKLIPSSNCGMAPLARGAALDKLGVLPVGADIVRAELVSR